MHPFEYRKPTDAQVDDMRALTEPVSKTYDLILDRVPPSAERPLAIRSLQLARFWINVAILGITIETQ